VHLPGGSFDALAGAASLTEQGGALLASAPAGNAMIVGRPAGI
jgi:hypothetical protein